MLSGSDGFVLYGKRRFDFYSTFDLQYSNTKGRLGLIILRPSFHVITGNPDVNLENVEYSLHNGRFAGNDDYHEKKTDLFAYTLV